MLINADFKKAWLTAQEVTEVFGIPYANVKSAQWRKESKFPSHQPGDRPSYYYIKYSKKSCSKSGSPGNVLKCLEISQKAAILKTENRPI